MSPLIVPNFGEIANDTWLVYTLRNMSELWFDFGVVILTQLILFIVHAYYEKRLRDVPKILFTSMLIGIPFGIVFDLIVGEFVGLYSYQLGSGIFFLAINGALSYGLMQANALLMQRAHLLHFYVWTLVVGVVYEMSNHYFRVWTWDFGSFWFETFIVHAFGYIGLAVLMALTWHFLLGHKFTFIERMLTRWHSN
jgi:Na+/citrate or Na+/malate symporter